jgi:hypothetical protein
LNPHKDFQPPKEGFMKIARFFQGERGGVAVAISLLLVVFAGMLAVAVDLGHVFKVKAELQRAADAGALAGVLEMFPPGVLAPECAKAVSAAQEFASFKNRVDGAAGEIILVDYGKCVRDPSTGEWAKDPETGEIAFSPCPCQDANAVRVKIKKEMGIWFASIFGVKAMSPFAEAIAVSKIGGYAKKGEAFPFCIDKSRVPPNDTAKEILINTQSSDFGCWTPFEDPNGKVKDYLDGTLSAPPLWIGKVINVKNGVDTSDLKIIEGSYINQTITVPVITDGQHSGTTAILGFAKVKILGVEKPGGGSGDKFIRMHTLDQYYQDDGILGGGNLGSDFHLGGAGGALLVK